MKHILGPGEGGILTLGPPSAGELVIKAGAGGSFALAVQTLLPGAELPVCRHLRHEHLFFIHKGQGRATVDGESMTVVPGMVIHAPPASWHGLRNTGTGALQFAWISVPAGLEEYFREIARAGASDAVARHQIGARHDVEFRPADASASPGAPARPGRRRRRGGRGRSRRGGAPRMPEAVRQRAPGSAAAEPANQPAAAAGAAQPAGGLPAPRHEGKGDPSSARQAGARRRRRRRGGRGPKAASPQAATGAAERSAGAPVAGPARSGGGPASAKRRERGGRRRFGRVKEVYMGGRWVRVVGDGPVISTGEGGAGKPEDEAL
jgi:mannose-6-phosphate isomerase-like protein (cupin superfamily)